MAGTQAQKHDYELIEKYYRAGVLSIREISRKTGCPESTIRKKAKDEDWERDLVDKVRKRAQEKLLRKSVRKPNASEKDVVEENSNVIVNVVELHRKDTSKGRELVGLLYGQLETAAKTRDELEDTIIEVTPPDEKGKIDFKRRNAMMKAISLPAHAAVLRDLSTALKNLIPLERQAFNLDEGPLGDDIEEVRFTFKKS